MSLKTGDYLERNVLVVDGAGSIELSGDSGDAQLQYGGDTNLIVQGDPGEIITSTLVDIFDPPVYAIGDYSSDLKQPIDLSTRSGTVLDYSSGVDAQAFDIQQVSANDDYSLAWRFIPSTRIEIPAHQSRDSIVNGGLNFSIRTGNDIPDATRLIEWAGIGLSLLVNADQTLTLVGSFAQGEQSVTSTNTIQHTRWNNIALHFYAGALRLGLNGEEFSLAVSESLVSSSDQSYDLLIAADGAENLTLAGIKLYDWDTENALAFAGGGLEASAVADTSGQATIALVSSAPTVAYTRKYYEPSAREVEGFYASIRNGLVPTAFALPQNDEECDEASKPIVDGVADPTVCRGRKISKDNAAMRCTTKSQTSTNKNIKKQTVFLKSQSP